MMIGMGIPSNQSRIGISVSLNFVVANAAVGWLRSVQTCENRH